MHQFKDLNIKTERKAFSGEKIDISEVFNKEIVVEDYKMGISKYKDNPAMATIQVLVDEKSHIIFTTSTYIIEDLEEIDKLKKFPFKTTIIKKNRSFQFT